MYYRLFSFLILTIIAARVQAQKDVLDIYVAEALESNIALQQKELSYEKSLAALQEAKGLFFPKLSLEARYSVARGGRAFEIPIGDLMNPVYENLNLINSLGQDFSSSYPVIPEYRSIENEQVNFLRETEHETKLRVAMPVFNSAILQNNKIKQNLSEADRLSVSIYKKELVKEVKTAYFNYAKAVKAKELYDNTLNLVKENQRTTQSLFDNHKVTKDAVYTAQAEVESIHLQLAEAEKNEKVAAAFFNFLLNRPYDSTIELMPESEFLFIAMQVEEARKQAFGQREELQQLNYYLSAKDNQVQLTKGNYLPNLNIVADYGFQGTHYKFDSDSDFAMGSVVMSWNLFDKTSNAKVQQARIEKEELQKQKEEVRQQIGLQVVNAFFDLEAGLKAISAAKAEVEATNQAFRLVHKKYTQGQANLIEWTDARTKHTNAEQKLIIVRYDYQIKQAEFERAISK